MYLNYKIQFMWVLLFILACFFKFQMDKIKSPLRPSGYKDWSEKISKLYD